MSRTKRWTPGDRALAICWIASKSVFKEQEQQAMQMLDDLKKEQDPNLFASKAKSIMTDEAWKRMLGTLRQHKHKARHEGDQAT